MKVVKLNRLFAIALLLLGSIIAQAQLNCIEEPPGSGNFINPVTGAKCITTIQTAVPFLTITPDARSAAMGDVGIALSPTAASTYFNGSALAFTERPFEIQATFTPWLRALNLNDVYLANLAGFGRLDDLQVIYGSLRYFSLGSIQFTDQNGQPISNGKPYEMAISGGYARKLTDEWSASIAGRFVLSSLASGLQVPGEGEIIGNGTSGAADLGVTYTSDISIGNSSTLRAGANVRNIGAKISYTNSNAKDFLPTNLGIGSSLQTYFDDFNSFTFSFDFNKLLVPSPQTELIDVSPANDRNDYLDQSPIEGIFSSFGDAQGGFSEELAEINLSVGAEYWYADQFAVRAGYFNEDNTKGGRKYLTLGVGLKYNVLGLDFSYLIPTTSVRNPLDNTLRFGLSYLFDSDQPEGVDL
ncbi:MAG: type IX secretion system outer membrane channel protein PorV [Saprospiraceae bacterium]